MSTQHLWEVDHPYYCNEGNFFARESVGVHYKRWSDFESDNARSDFDLNLVFRWDWDEIDGETEKSTYTGDDNYRNGTLKVFWMGQRKGLYRYSTVEVCRADEPAVIAFLGSRLQHLLKLWEPLNLPTTGSAS